MDIVERLRSFGPDWTKKITGSIAPYEVCANAADRIESDAKVIAALKERLATIEAAQSSDYVLLDRALGILHRMATERTGWRRFLSRWYYSDEPLRNDAANLVREACPYFGMMLPINSQLIGEDAIQRAISRVQ